MTSEDGHSARRIAASLVIGATLMLTAACTTTISGSGTRATAFVPYRGDRFTVSMPGTPVEARQRVPSPVGLVTATVLTVEQDDRSFVVAYIDYPAGSRYDLRSGARGAAAFMHGQEVDLHRVTYRGRPALDVRIVDAVGGQGTGFLRLVVVDNRVYELLAAVNGRNVKTAPDEYPVMRDSLMF